jgi:hypothetical protein
MAAAGLRDPVLKCGDEELLRAEDFGGGEGGGVAAEWCASNRAQTTRKWVGVRNQKRGERRIEAREAVGET